MIEPLSSGNRAAVVAHARPTWDRPTGDDYFGWRYADCPAQEAMIAMAGGACVATMFAFRRRFLTPQGERECLEPFDWHTTEEWRARGAGLLVVKKFMAGDRPIIALGGTDAAKAIFRRLRWTEIATATRWDLPRRGTYLVERGRSPAVGRAFDLLGAAYYTPEWRREEVELLEPASSLAPEVERLARAQRRFALMRLPDPETQHWLARAPAAAGSFQVFHVRLGGRLAGWATVRLHRAVGMRIAAIQELFLGDEFTAAYPAVLRGLTAMLDATSPDVITTVTSCPLVTAALKSLRFRVGDLQSVFAWWPGGTPPQGPILLDGAHAEWICFPIASAAEAAWISSPRA